MPEKIQITLADIFLANVVRTIQSGSFGHIPSDMSAYPKCVALVDTVYEHPKIKEYYAARPPK